MQMLQTLALLYSTDDIEKVRRLFNTSTVFLRVTNRAERNKL